MLSTKSQIVLSSGERKEEDEMRTEYARASTVQCFSYFSYIYTYIYMYL